MLPVIVEKQGFGTAFAFIVTRAKTDGIDVSPIVFRLWVDFRIAVNFAGGGLQDFGFSAFGQPQHIDGTVYAGFGGLYGVVLIVDGRGRTGQIVDFIYFDIQGKSDVVAQQFKMGIIEQMLQVVLPVGHNFLHEHFLLYAHRKQEVSQ